MDNLILDTNIKFQTGYFEGGTLQSVICNKKVNYFICKKEGMFSLNEITLYSQATQHICRKSLFTAWSNGGKSQILQKSWMLLGKKFTKLSIQLPTSVYRVLAEVAYLLQIFTTFENYAGKPSWQYAQVYHSSCICLVFAFHQFEIYFYNN